MPVVERPDTARISWESDGPEDAPAVLLLMGLAYPAAMWFRLVPALAESHRVIRIDNRGAGRTGDVPGAPYTVETMAADSLAVLDAADVDTAHIVGLSMGGLIAQEIVLTAPERVRSLCLIATHPGIAHAVMNPQAMAMLTQRGQMTPQEAAEASIPYNYAPETPRERIEEDWAVRFPLAASNEGYLAQVVGSSRWDGYSRMEGITAPTLVVAGAEDPALPPQHQQAIAERIPGAELLTVSPGAHLATLERTLEITGALLAHLEGAAR